MKIFFREKNFQKNSKNKFKITDFSYRNPKKNKKGAKKYGALPGMNLNVVKMWG